MDLFILKKFLHNIVNCVVLFSKEQENEAIDFYTRKMKGCFVILDGREIPKFKKGDVVVSCFGDFDQASVKDGISALYYVKVDSEELKNIEEYNEYICQIMNENLKKFELYDICIREHVGILRYKTADYDLESEEKNITIINLLYGIGDFFILSSIYYELIEEHRQHGKKVYLEFFAQEDNIHQRTRNMCELFFHQEASYVLEARNYTLC